MNPTDVFAESPVSHWTDCQPYGLFILHDPILSQFSGVTPLLIQIHHGHEKNSVDPDQLASSEAS